MVPFYSDITWAPWHIKSPTTQQFVQPLIQAYIKHKYQSSALLMSGFYKKPLTQKMFECHDIIILDVYLAHFPADTKRNKHVIITSKRRFDVIITYLLRCVFAVLLAWGSWPAPEMSFITKHDLNIVYILFWYAKVVNMVEVALQITLTSKCVTSRHIYFYSAHESTGKSMDALNRLGVIGVAVGTAARR